MAVKDQEKTAFITPFGAFCYVSMPFGSRVPRQLINGVYKIVFTSRLAVMYMLTWMISWLNPGRRRL